MVNPVRSVPSRIWKTAYIFAALYSLSLVLGYGMYDTNSAAVYFSSAKSFLLFIGAVIILTAVLGFAMALLLKFICTAHRGKAGNSSRLAGFFGRKHARLYIWLIIFCSWLPCYLAYFPGVFSYDIITQTAMLMGDIPYSTIVPPLHTLIWVICCQIQEVLHTNNAIVFYSVFQMLLFSFILSEIPVFIERKTGSGMWSLLCFLFFTVNPVVALMSFSTTKAVLFAAFFALMVIRLWDFVTDTEAYESSRKKRFGFMLAALLACLFRGNAFVCLILLIPFAINTMKKNRKLVLKLLAVPVAMYLLINNVFFPAIGFEGGSSSELLVVQIQQLANVCSQHSDELNGDDASAIEELFSCSCGDVGSIYNPRFADPAKNLFHLERSNALKFIKLWTKLGIKYPLDYADAFLTLNLPYWYQDADAVDAFSQRQYIETSLGGDKHFGGYGYYWFFRDSKLPSLYEFYEKAADYSMFRNIPVISNIFSLSFPIWLTAFCLAVLRAKGLKAERLVLLPAFFQWLIFIFGPVSNFRYIFPIFVLYPVFLAISFSSESGSENQ